MTHFWIDHNTCQSDRIFVEIDRRLCVAIIRTESGLDLHVYPRTDRLLWDDPFDRFQVDESEIMTLEQELEA
jgi:hypothetical protein